MELQRPAEQGLDPQKVEEVRGYPSSRYPLRLIQAGHGQVRAAPSGDVVEALQSGLESGQGRLGDAGLGVELDHDETVRFGEGKRPHQDLVDAGEDRRVRPDSEPDRRNRDAGESEVAIETAKSEPKVVPERLHTSTYARASRRAPRRP